MSGCVLSEEKLSLVKTSSFRRTSWKAVFHKAVGYYVSKAINNFTMITMLVLTQC